MKLELIECTQNDCELIYSMANDFEVRKNSFNCDYINYEDHCLWYEKNLKDKNRFMFIAKEGENVIGQIRLDKISNKALISYSIEKRSRGKGYANMLLEIVKIKAKEKEIEVLHGMVKKDNIASRKVFLKNNFVEYERENNYEYVFDLKGCMNIGEYTNRK